MLLRLQRDRERLGLRKGLYGEHKVQKGMAQQGAWAGGSVHTHPAPVAMGSCAASKKDEQDRNSFIKYLWSTFYLSSTEANIC